MTSTGAPAPAQQTMRAALGNRPLARAPLAYLACTMAEWAQLLAVLVYAYAQSGARAAGFASLALVLPMVVAAPLASAAAARWRPERVLQAAATVQVLVFAAAGVACWVEAPIAVVVAVTAVGVGGIVMQRPSYAVLLPSLVRSPRELSVGNVWFGWCESAATLAGPLLATGLFAADGPGLVLVGCSVLSALAVVALLGIRRTGAADAAPHAHHRDGDDDLHRSPGLVASVRALRQRRGAVGVLAVASGQYVLLGALDLLLVVLAIDVLDIGKAGSGWLSTALGVGALSSALGATTLLRRPRLAPFLAISLAVIAVSLAVLAAVPSVPVALVILPIVGCSRAVLSLCGRMLLQRSSPPQALAAVFAALELLAGISMTLGSVMAQLLLAAGGPRLAIGCVGGVFAVLLAFTWRSLRVADDGADVPVVAMSLLRRLPLFAPLPPFALEAVARAATEVQVRSGDVVIVEGEVGDRFYAVVDGRFEVVMGGEQMRSVTRGGDFGEVALLADVPRTATVTAASEGSLLAIDRDPFLLALTGSPTAHEAAWGRVRAMRFLDEVPAPPATEADQGPTSSSSSPR